MMLQLGNQSFENRALGQHYVTTRHFDFRSEKALNPVAHVSDIVVNGRAKLDGKSNTGGQPGSGSLLRDRCLC